MLASSCSLDKLPHYFLSSASQGKLSLSFWSGGRAFKGFVLVFGYCTGSTSGTVWVEVTSVGHGVLGEGGVPVADCPVLSAVGSYRCPVGCVSRLLRIVFKTSICLSWCLNCSSVSVCFCLTSASLLLSTLFFWTRMLSSLPASCSGGSGCWFEVLLFSGCLRKLCVLL